MLPLYSPHSSARDAITAICPGMFTLIDTLPNSDLRHGIHPISRSDWSTEALPPSLAPSPLLRTQAGNVGVIQPVFSLALSFREACDYLTQKAIFPLLLKHPEGIREERVLVGFKEFDPFYKEITSGKGPIFIESQVTSQTICCDLFCDLGTVANILFWQCENEVLDFRIFPATLIHPAPVSSEQRKTLLGEVKKLLPLLKPLNGFYRFTFAFGKKDERPALLSFSRRPFRPEYTEPLFRFLGVSYGDLFKKKGCFREGVKKIALLRGPTTPSITRSSLSTSNVSLFPDFSTRISERHSAFPYCFYPFTSEQELKGKQRVFRRMCMEMRELTETVGRV